ncbi:hypothetical protein ATCC90586_002606 [Pythium insidiosum]|nr:hypothetical protein ATCC90586_002606 [Pythium insidiosum]
MTNASAEDKRADERRIKELRDFQRANPANKRCFDCNEMAAQKIWRAKHDASYRPSGGNEGERTRNFIRLTYIDRKWAYESPKNSSHDEPQRTSSKGAKRSTLGPDDDFASSRAKSSSSAAAASFDAFSQPTTQQNNGGFSAFGDFTSFDQPKKQQNDFEDFGGFGSSSSAGGFGGFGGFSTPQPAAAPPLRDEFKTGSFKLAPPPGSDFAAFSAPTPPAPTVSVPTPQASNDFLAFSPPKANPQQPADPFAFAAGGASSKTNSFSGSQQAPQGNTGSFGNGRPAYGMPMPGQTMPGGSQQLPQAGFNMFGNAPQQQGSVYASQGQFPMHDQSQFGAQMNQMHNMHGVGSFPQAQPANSSKQNSFAASDPFAGFSSSSSRTGSQQQTPAFATPPAAAAASNPFDMF